ncbi:MAG: hypothetical protein NTV86_17750 [Planctomycetota bacterium]|nr:hypothetical protein [Planctomycetota bacterium]
MRNVCTALLWAVGLLVLSTSGVVAQTAAAPASRPAGSPAEWADRARQICAEQKYPSTYSRMKLTEALARAGKAADAWAVVKASGHYPGAYLEYIVRGQTQAGDFAGARRSIADAADESVKDIGRELLATALARHGDLKDAQAVAGEIKIDRYKAGAQVGIIAAQADTDVKGALAAAEALAAKDVQTLALAAVARAQAAAGDFDAARATAAKLSTESVSIFGMGLASRSFVLIDVKKIQAAAPMHKVRQDLIGADTDAIPAIAPSGEYRGRDRVFKILDTALAAAGDPAAARKAMSEAQVVIPTLKDYPNHYQSHGWTYMALTLAALHDAAGAKAAAARAFEVGLKDEIGGFASQCAPNLGALLVIQGDVETALQHVQAFKDADTAAPMAQAIGYAMVRHGQAAQLLQLLPKVTDPTRGMFLCLGASMTPGK